MHHPWSTSTEGGLLQNLQQPASSLIMNNLIGPAVRADFRQLYPANAKMSTCCPSDDNRTKVTNSVTSAPFLWWHVGPYFWPADLTQTANPISLVSKYVPLLNVIWLLQHHLNTEGISVHTFHKTITETVFCSFSEDPSPSPSPFPCSHLAAMLYISRSTTSEMFNSGLLLQVQQKFPTSTLHAYYFVTCPYHSREAQSLYYHQL